MCDFVSSNVISRNRCISDDCFADNRFAENRLDALPPAELIPWLHVQGSLTAKLEVKAGQPLRVERQFEGYRLLSLTQKRQLGLQGGALNRPMLAWIREAKLYGNEALPWVQAQSIFPLVSLQGDARRLRHLKGTPIGYVLFKRSRTLPSQRFIAVTAEGWQRQTRYDWYGRKLLISETFLDTFMPFSFS